MMRRKQRKDWSNHCSVRGCDNTPATTFKTEVFGGRMFSVRLCTTHENMTVLDVLRANRLVNGS